MDAENKVFKRTMIVFNPLNKIFLGSSHDESSDFKTTLDAYEQMRLDSDAFLGGIFSLDKHNSLIKTEIWKSQEDYDNFITKNRNFIRNLVSIYEDYCRQNKMLIHRMATTILRVDLTDSERKACSQRAFLREAEAPDISEFLVYRKIRVRKDPVTSTYIYHIENDVEFNTLDKQGNFYRHLLTEMKDPENLEIQIWADVPRYRQFLNYEKSETYQKYLLANAHTRYDVEDFSIRSFPEIEGARFIRIESKTPLVDRHNHKVSETLFSLDAGLLSACAGLKILNQVIDKDDRRFWSLIIYLTEAQRQILTPYRDTFKQRLENYFEEQGLDANVIC